MKTLEQWIEMAPAFDRRHSDPSKNYGIHGCTLSCYLRGEHGAIQFVIYTSWHLPTVQRELVNKIQGPSGAYLVAPMPSDFGYHAITPQYEGQTRMDACHLLPQGYCYYDGSSLRAQTVFDEVLTPFGTDGLWRYMEWEYYEIFADGV